MTMRINFISCLIIGCSCYNAIGSRYYAVLNGKTCTSDLLTNTSNVNKLLTCASDCENQECQSFMYNADTEVCSTFSRLNYISFGATNINERYCHKGKGCSPINVYGKWAKCDIYNSKRWTIVQRRYDGSLKFNKTWDEFKAGFGDLDGEYWLGNEILHLLTRASNLSAMFVMEDWNGVEKYAQYDSIKVSSEADKYRITVSGYSGTAGDSMSWHSGAQFSTKDSDNDLFESGSCSLEYSAGFWFNHCIQSNINGLYVVDNGGVNRYALVWISFSGRFQPMKKSRMMLASAP